MTFGSIQPAGNLIRIMKRSVLSLLSVSMTGIYIILEISLWMCTVVVDLLLKQLPRHIFLTYCFHKTCPQFSYKTNGQMIYFNIPFRIETLVTFT